MTLEGGTYRSCYALVGMVRCREEWPINGHGPVGKEI